MKNLDWANLPFGYMKTDYNVRCYYRDGKWGEIEVCSDEYLNLHMAATCLHYGQEAFEGLKAYRCKDGKVRIFRVDENAARLQSTCRGILMPEVSTELFTEMVNKVVRLNHEELDYEGFLRIVEEKARELGADAIVDFKSSLKKDVSGRPTRFTASGFCILRD